MSIEGTAFAGTVIEIDGVVIGKVTSFKLNYDVSEEEVSGAEDTVGSAGTEITEQLFMATAIGKTASIEGIALDDTTGDTGQSDLEDAVEQGDTIVLRQYNQHGIGYRLQGYFTSYAKTGSLPGVYTFSADFRVNKKTAVSGSPS